MATEWQNKGEPISFGQIPDGPVKWLANLATRDLDSCIRYPHRTNWWTRWGERFENMGNFLSRRPKRYPIDSVPTYRPVSKDQEMFDLLLQLPHCEGIDFAGQDLLTGKARLACLDQLALSLLSQDQIFELSSMGYGYWPVEAGLTVDRINWGNLGSGRSAKQQKFLDEVFAKEKTRVVRGVWLKEDKLTVGKPLIGDNYLPSFLAVLRAMELFYDQEQQFPDTRGKWFYTNPSFDMPLGEIGKKATDNIDSLQMLFDACIDHSSDARRIYYHLNQPGSYETSSSSESVVKKGTNLEIRDYYGRTIFCKEGNKYLYVRSSLDSKIIIDGRTVEFLDYYGRVVYQTDTTTLTDEIDSYLTGFRTTLDKTFTFSPVIKSDKIEGAKMGFCPDNLYKGYTWQLAQGKLPYTFWWDNDNLVSKALGGWPVVYGASWPNIFSDKMAQQLIPNPTN